jgi:hypothetical protein
MGLRNGRVYNLAIDKLDLVERAFGHYPFSWKVIAFRPFDKNTPLMPYCSMEAFEKNWSKVDDNPRKTSEVLLKIHK